MDPTIFHRLLATHFRPSRMLLFYKEMGITAETRVLDVGGAPGIWDGLPFRPRVTLLNFEEGPIPPHFGFIKADARELPVDSNSFDVCFSNSLIEHLWTWEDQQRAAGEMRRVAKHYFVQTPNFWFPVEPHFLAPCFHWLPMWLRKKLAFLTPFQLSAHADPAELMRTVEEIRLLTAADMRALFPEARILRERFGGLTKSLIAAH